MSTSDALSAAKPMEEGSELLNPWLQRWNANKIGFHQTDIHETLIKFGSTIIPNFDGSDDTCTSENKVRVFVPLCGKTVDMAYLASHPSVDQVVGIEGIRQALVEFSEEQSALKVRKAQISQNDDAYERFVGNDIMLLKGDFFGLDATAAGGKVDIVWDRASMVAIDPSLRKDYVQVMHGLVKPGGKILLATLERRTGTEDAVKAGPPFSISEAQVRELYETKDWVESVTLLQEVDEFARNPDTSERFKNMGVSSFFEIAFVIKIRE